MEQQRILDSYKLGKLKLILNNKNHCHSCAIEKDSSSITQISKNEYANMITIESKVIIREALNHCLKPKAELLKIWIKNKCIAVNLVTKQGAYSFATMNYYTYLEVLPSSFSDKISICIEDVATSHKATAITLKIYLHQDGKTLNQMISNNEIWAQFGSNSRKQAIQFEIASFSLFGIYVSKPPVIKDSKFENKFEFIDGLLSMPLGVILSPNQIYENFNLSNASLPSLEEFIKKLPSHESPPFEKQTKLYLCHDMKGGYLEDTNFNNNFVENIKLNNLEYRSLHLQQSQIFNYFSHYNITIPPLHWRLACKNAKTKCLGTFIIQKQVYSEDTLTSKQFALFLVGIAKKCKFDGYLMNIETKITNIAVFKKWLGFLTSKMHENIPNSVIIWYDSISQRDGNIRYQNSLSGEQNYQFYHITDGFFTNYWWNDDLLKKTSQLKNSNPKRVYIGNDCFGRNTYGGGMYNIYKATNKILQYKNDLSIALFAPGYTYQDNGQYNRQLFHLNELSMYKGIKSQVIAIDKWKYITKPEGWKKEGDWTATSFEVCERSALFNFPPLQKGNVLNVQFMVEVMGTPPISDSPFKIVLQVVDQSNNTLYQNQAHNFTNYRKTTQRPQLIVCEVSISEQMVSSNPFGIRVIEMGKCREYWAGHFGPRFKDEKIFVLIYEKDRHWISKIPVNQIKIGQPYHSLCNSGIGDHFHFLGNKLQQKYSYLADFDLPHTHIINHPFETELSYDHAFIGGTSLTIKRQAVKLLKVVIPKGLDLKKQYYIQITAKDTPNIQLNFKYISKNQEERIFSAKILKVDDINEWKRFTFQLITVVGQVKTDIRSIIDIVSSKHPYILGEINIVQKSVPQKAAIKCTLQISRDYVPTSHYYLNVSLESSSHQRLLITFDNFAAFAYFQSGKASLSNIPIIKCDSFSIKVIDVDTSIQHIVLRDYVVQSVQIANLIINGSISI